MASIRQRNGKWQVQVRRSGHKSINRIFIQKSEAQKWARQREIAIENGTSRTGSEQCLKTPLSKILTRYQRDISAHKAGEQVERYIIKHWLSSSLSALPIGSIRPSDIAAELDRQRLVWKPSTIRKNFGLLRHIFNTAIELWDIPLQQNPASKVPLPSVAQNPVRRIPSGFWSALEKHYELRAKNNIYWVIHFACQTGLRRGEISNLIWTDIDRHSGLLTVRASKTHRPRTIPLSSPSMSVLEAVHGQSESVFNMSPNAIRLAWQRLRKDANLGSVRFHDLRHEAISRFFEMGLTVLEVASISGHKTTSMLFRYAHADTQRLREKILNSKSLLP